MNAPKIMVFRPTMEEFKDFSRYIQYMESQGAHLAGIAKVIPPKEWVPRKSYDNIDNFVIPAPIEQVVSGQKGLYTQYNIQRKPVTVKEFRRLTNTPRYEPPFHESYSELERVYWKNITFNSAIYGADISGSLYDENIDVWNVARLNTLLDVIERDSGVKIEGVNTAYLYFGMWKTTFAWHTEDMDLYSINYVHFGAPKSWYAIPPEHGKRLERLAAGFYPNDKSNCSSFLRHKMTLISPSILRQYGIPVDKVTQEAGEFIITFPYGYHAGFNHGFNCAESTNFASERWINYGKAAEKCTCRNDTVTIDMDLFVQLFQPKQYESWKTKKNETKLSYNEIPLSPDMSKPFPSWKARVEEFRRLYDISTFLKKITKPEKNKITPKHKTSRCPKKSSQKHKKTKEKRPLINSVKLQQVIQKVDCTPIVRGGIKQESIPSTSSQEPSSLTIASDYPMDLPSPYTLPEQCLFDRVKTGTRRKSSANAISSEDDAERTLNKHSITDSSLTSSISSIEEDRTSKSILQLNSDLSTSSCSVQCEQISTLPFEIISKEPLVVKEPSIPVQSSLKRRHPVIKKVPKKTSPDILVKRGRSSTDGEASPAVKKEKKEKQEGKPCFKDELLYNETIAKHPPHCAICSLFRPYHSTPQTDLSTLNGIPASIPPAPPGRPKYVAGDCTAPLIPEVSFASNVNNPSPLAECQLLDKDGKSPLLQCCVCRVQVHASCYGIVDPPTSEDTSDKDVNTPVWTCNRCLEKSWNAKCSLCCNRGGALKRISTGLNWAHVVCAIAIPEVYFEDTVQRSKINVSKLPAKRLKLKCVYRKKTHQCSGVCLQCCSGRCTVAFHATCAHAAGIPIEPGNWPFPVYVHCHKHTMLRTKGKVEPQKPVEVDRYVLAKHKNGKYYHAVVKKLKKETFYKVNFKDNSWSDNLYSQDLVSHDWSSGESPVVGSMVEVKWTDGEIYEAEYRGHSVQESIQVEFEDGLLVEFERNEIFTEDDPMPSNIRRKLRSQVSLKPAYE